jgi:AraC-like DNA-binding protein
MRNLLLALVLIWVVVGVRHLLFPDTFIGVLIIAGLTPVLVLFLSALGLYGLLQKSIPLPAPVQPDKAVPAAATAPGKYQNSTLTDEQQANGLKQLQAAMARDKLYLDSELTLTGLASHLQLPPRHLSQIINSCTGQNFIDFVNGCRVEEARRLLANRTCTSSILSIAMDVGFNSKSAFYNAFKRHSGQTPSQYRDDCLKTAVAAPSLNRN